MFRYYLVDKRDGAFNAIEEPPELPYGCLRLKLENRVIDFPDLELRSFDGQKWRVYDSSAANRWVSYQNCDHPDVLASSEHEDPPRRASVPDPVGVPVLPE